MKCDSHVRTQISNLTVDSSSWTVCVKKAATMQEEKKNHEKKAVNMQISVVEEQRNHVETDRPFPFPCECVASVLETS